MNGGIQNGAPSSREGKTDENVRIIEMQKGEIRKLRSQLQEAEHFMSQRPPSGSKLPPVLAQWGVGSWVEL